MSFVSARALQSLCAVVGIGVAWCSGAVAGDLSSIVATPTAGQTAQQLRRDRYECHNWVLANGAAVPAQPEYAGQTKRERRAERIGQVITGAAIGAAAGGIIRGASDHREADDGALAGGVLGAIAGAVIGRRNEREQVDAAFDDYFRGLDACMTARGYRLSISGVPDSD